MILAGVGGRLMGRICTLVRRRAHCNQVLNGNIRSHACSITASNGLHPSGFIGWQPAVTDYHVLLLDCGCGLNEKPSSPP